MSIQNNPIHSSSEILEFYRDNLTRYGDTAQGVGWKDQEAQNIRFKQLSKIIDNKDNFSVNDLGCGTGQFFKYLMSNGYNPLLYVGYDILEEMIRQATDCLCSSSNIKLVKINSESEMELSDYTVASGIFNVRYKAKQEEWTDHILATLDSLNKRSKLGFAFNLLSKYSDAEFMRQYLYYGDPLFFFDYCKRNFSKHVALLHDYGQFDFTILVRKAPPLHLIG